MKIKQKVYFCPWCPLQFKQVVNRLEGNGRKGVGVDQCICPQCGRHVSQKTKIELDAKRGISE